MVSLNKSLDPGDSHLCSLGLKWDLSHHVHWGGGWRPELSSSSLFPSLHRWAFSIDSFSLFYCWNSHLRYWNLWQTLSPLEFTLRKVALEVLSHQFLLRGILLVLLWQASYSENKGSFPTIRGRWDGFSLLCAAINVKHFWGDIPVTIMFHPHTALTRNPDSSTISVRIRS